MAPLQDPEFAVEAIERCAPDRRFLQVLVLAMGELPLGRRASWPVLRRRTRLLAQAAKPYLPIRSSYNSRTRVGGR